MNTKIEENLVMVRKLGVVGIVLLSLVLVFNNLSNNPLSSERLSKNTVLIKGLMAGGTGVILSSSPTVSKVLTNRHVCEAIASGGDVFDYKEESHGILAYRASKEHDLCLMDVSGNLGITNHVAMAPPKLFDEVVVSGHPYLLPTTITKGVITGRLEGIVSGANFHAITISALIAPGSSGSAVYNRAGDIIGLVFAGIGGVSFGIVVPWEYLSYFLNNEYYTLPVLTQTSAGPTLTLNSTPKKSPNKASDATLF